MLRSAALGAGDRVSTHERRGRARVPLDRLDDLAFRAAHVGDEHVGRSGFGDAEDIDGNAIHGRADDDKIGVGDGRFEVGGSSVDGAQSNSLVRATTALRPTPITCEASRRARSARPIDPPIKPTPMMTAVPKRGKE